MRRHAHTAAKNQVARNLKAQAYVERATREARTVPAEDQSGFTMSDLKKLEEHYASFANFREQLKQLNRTMMVHWKERVRENLCIPDRKHLDLEARSDLKRFAAWKTINAWLISPSDSYKGPGMIIEWYLRARWVDGGACWLVAEIERDFWESELGPYECY